jgi:hypothetical protein
MPAPSRYAFTSFADLAVGECFEFDTDYAGKRWPDSYKKTGSRTFRDVTTGRSGNVRAPAREPVDEQTCPVFAGAGTRRRRRRT